MSPWRPTGLGVCPVLQEKVSTAEGAARAAAAQLEEEKGRGAAALVRVGFVY